jgi:hypothetical protein
MEKSYIAYKYCDRTKTTDDLYEKLYNVGMS